MNAPQRIITTARLGVSGARLCRCCSEFLTPEEFPAPDYLRDDVATALLVRYGALPCTLCAEAHAACDGCSRIFPGDALLEACGHRYCRDCAYDAALDAVNDQAERRAWECER